MVKRSWLGVLGIVMFVGGSFAVSACSNQQTTDVAISESNEKSHEITVYESPT